MTTIAESATITITKATLANWNDMIAKVVESFRAIAKALAEATAALVEAFHAVSDFFADLDRKAHGRPRWMVLQDEKFAHRGALSTLPVRGASPR